MNFDYDAWYVNHSGYVSGDYDGVFVSYGPSPDVTWDIGISFDYPYDAINVVGVFDSYGIWYD